MQSRAEKHLVQSLIQIIRLQSQTSLQNRLLNIGAGHSISIEKQLSDAGCQYLCDRLDVDDCLVSYPAIGDCWTCSVEAMFPVQSSCYQAAFANYVFEHISNPDLAAKEIHRILKSNACFVISIPNPTAIEFRISKHTPLWLHKAIRQSHAWETHYAYQGINQLISVFKENGLLAIDVQYYPAVGSYLHKFPILSTLGSLYDRIVEGLYITGLLGDVCVVFQKQDLLPSKIT
jgi:hypothetical protein